VAILTISILNNLCARLQAMGEKAFAALASVMYHTQARGEEVIRMKKGDVQ
jgi:hypothetical protein